jgi:hypothetical protein
MIYWNGDRREEMRKVSYIEQGYFIFGKKFSKNPDAQTKQNIPCHNKNKPLSCTYIFNMYIMQGLFLFQGFLVLIFGVRLR